MLGAKQEVGMAIKKHQDRELAVRRYGQSRLYDLNAKQYVSADALRTLQAEGARIVVREAESGQDVTGAVLATGTKH